MRTTCAARAPCSRDASAPARTVRRDPPRLGIPWPSVMTSGALCVRRWHPARTSLLSVATSPTSWAQLGNRWQMHCSTRSRPLSRHGARASDQRHVPRAGNLRARASVRGRCPRSSPSTSPPQRTPETPSRAWCALPGVSASARETTARLFPLRQTPSRWLRTSRDERPAAISVRGPRIGPSFAVVVSVTRTRCASLAAGSHRRVGASRHACGSAIGMHSLSASGAAISAAHDSGAWRPRHFRAKAPTRRCSCGTSRAVRWLQGGAWSEARSTLAVGSGSQRTSGASG